MKNRTKTMDCGKNELITEMYHPKYGKIRLLTINGENYVFITDFLGALHFDNVKGFLDFANDSPFITEHNLGQISNFLVFIPICVGSLLCADKRKSREIWDFLCWFLEETPKHIKL